MTVITEHEEEQISKANASGLAPVVFVHGLWLLPSSWDRWAAVFADAGYAPLTPSWPDDPGTVEEANEHPEVFARKTVGQVADHVGEVIAKLEVTPAVIGHSFGGLLAQIVAGRGSSASPASSRNWSSVSRGCTGCWSRSRPRWPGCRCASVRPSGPPSA